MSEQNPSESNEIVHSTLPPTPTKPKFFPPSGITKKAPIKTPPRSQSPTPPPRKAPDLPPKGSHGLKKIPISSLKKKLSFGNLKVKLPPTPPPRPPPPKELPSSMENKNSEIEDNEELTDEKNLMNLSSENNNQEIDSCDKTENEYVDEENTNIIQKGDVFDDVVDENETYVDDELPPPPPPGESDFAFDSYKSPRDTNDEPTQFTNVFSEESKGENDASLKENENLEETQAQNENESREYSENDTPPQNLEPLPTSLHPKVPLPSLPHGIIHPDSASQNIENISEETENKKKKGKFTQLKGFFKNKKKKDEEDKKVKTKTKEEEHLVSAIADRLERYFKLVDLLSKEDNYLLNIISILVSRGDVDKQSRAWVRIFGPKGCLLSLLLRIIRNEVLKTEHEGTLFRNNTFPVGLLSQFAHSTGKEYLKSILVDNILEVIDEDKRYEVNPDGDGVGLTPDEIDQNTMNLLTSCEKIFNTIIASKNMIPPEIRRICKELRDRVREKFPGAVHTCVGGFLFLRFITPSIVSPEGFQLLNAEISIEKRRPLILISKTLQQIANDMYFSEDYLMSINSFITENVPILQTFFEEVCDVDDNISPNPFPEHVLDHETLRARDDALIRIHQFILKVLPDIKSLSQEDPPQDLNYDPVGELEKCLEALGEPPDPKILKQPVQQNIKKKEKKK